MGADRATASRRALRPRWSALLGPGTEPEAGLADAFAILEDEHSDWLAEEGRIELTFGAADEGAHTWDIEDVDVAIVIDA